MITYRYNLRELNYPEEDYKKTSQLALSLARGASAVDTGRFRTGWTVIVSGDILFVSNAVRYAPFVELGSVLYVKHRFRIRRALATLGLTKGSETFGPGGATPSTFEVGGRPGPRGTLEEGQIPTPPTEGQPPVPDEEQFQTFTIDQTGTIVFRGKAITEQEIRSPALLLNRLRAERATRQPVPSPITIIPKAQLFNRSRLLELILAAEIARQTQNNNEEN